MASKNNPRFATARVVVAIAALLSACGGASTSEPGVAAAGANRGAHRQATADVQDVAFEKSFIITDKATLDGLRADFTMTSLLHAISRHLNDVGGVDQQHDPDKFALNPFKVAGQDVLDHNNAAQAAKVGTIGRIYNSWNSVVIPNFNPAANVEPFRLIAVVNRLDLAGDFDRRDGGVLAGAERKWFGEARLIFAVDDPVQGTTLPMTISMEYRLPGLTTDASGTPVLDPSFDFSAEPSNKNWVLGRKLWANVWQDLSTYDLGSATYITKLQNIMSWIAYGIPYNHADIQITKEAKHHLAMRTGEKVRRESNQAQTSEFEYREFYLNGQWMLSTRKLRNEPFACANNSKTLADRIAADWSTATNSMSWRYTLGYRNMSQPEIDSTTASCGGTLPYGQVDDKGQDQDKDGVVDTQLRAKFARFIPTSASSVWTAIPPAPDQPLPENKTHGFAFGTCSGCHGSETGTGGFHLTPMPAASAPVLSSFLSGAIVGLPVRNAQYNYDERGRRMGLAAQFAVGTTPSLTDDPLLSDRTCNDENESCGPQ
jgi:hypothetical protein